MIYKIGDVIRVSNKKYLEYMNIRYSGTLIGTITRYRTWHKANDSVSINKLNEPYAHNGSLCIIKRYIDPNIVRTTEEFHELLERLYCDS